ncbi:hypothetical protein ACFWRZ_08770 [Streptomyces rubiginosohelvolus]|uniref:hypothetical protein n=1 Tax=Streptomyces rubiginosohelvolus TaxID=67362 RepID=UPI00365C2D27
MNDEERMPNHDDPGWGVAPAGSPMPSADHLVVAPAPNSKSPSFGDDAWWRAFNRAAAETELDQLFEDSYAPLVRFALTLTEDLPAAERLARTVFVRAAQEADDTAPKTAAWLWETARRLHDDEFLRTCGVQP